MINIILILVFLNFLIIFYFSKIKIFNINLDKPNKIRKFHSKAVPRSGGLLIFLNLTVYSILVNANQMISANDVFFDNLYEFNLFYISAFIIFVFGFVDDKLDINPYIKFIFITLFILIILFYQKQLIVENLNFSFLGRNYLLGDFSYFFTIFCFVVFLNAFNMFDGINLQTSIYSLILIIFFLIFIQSTFLICLGISIISYSYLNYKNKAFLGDSGSLLLGFVISYLIIKLYNLNYILFADKIILFMIIPGLELIRLFSLRIYNKKSPLSADREHLHHYLVDKFSQFESLLIISIFILSPLIMNTFKINNFLIINITIISYILLINYLKKKPS